MKHILLVLYCATLYAQTADPVPLSGNATLVQVTRSTGKTTFESVSVGSGVVVSRVGGVLTAVSTVVDTGAVKPTNAAWITLVQSTADTSGLTWCVSNQPPSSAPAYTVALLHEVQTVTDPASGQVFGPQDVYTDIQPRPTSGILNPGLSTSVPPTWIAQACGGGPGVVFPSNGLSTGAKRVSVSARVVW